MTQTTTNHHHIDLVDGDLTGSIIGAAIEVHTLLGPGFLELAYENALCIEMHQRGIRFTKQHQVPVIYKDHEVAMHQLDLLVEDRIVVELKAIKRIETVHLATVRAYLRAMDLTDGLILNFAAAPLGIRRVSGQAPRP